MSRRDPILFLHPTKESAERLLSHCLIYSPPDPYQILPAHLHHFCHPGAEDEFDPFLEEYQIAINYGALALEDSGIKAGLKELTAAEEQEVVQSSLSNDWTAAEFENQFNLRLEAKQQAWEIKYWCLLQETYYDLLEIFFATTREKTVNVEDVQDFILRPGCWIFTGGFQKGDFGIVVPPKPAEKNIISTLIL